MQELFHKDLEEIKESINNEQCNNWDKKKIWREPTVEWITEEEDRTSEMEDRMVEINEAERKKEKKN